MNTINHTFTENIYERVPGKRGGWGKYVVTGENKIEDTLIPVEFKFHDEKRVLYYRGSDTSRIKCLYTEEGKRAYGKWRHGRQGSKVHIEALQMYAESRKLVFESSYSSGQIRNQHKYLLSINE